MKTSYEHLSFVTVPLVDAAESLGLARAVCQAIAEKKLPRRFAVVTKRVLETTDALDKKLAKRARRGATPAVAVGRADTDVRADQLLGALHDVLQGFARVPEGLEVPQAAAARELLAVLFPEGLSAVVHASFLGQHERMKSAFAALEHRKREHAERLERTATSELVRELRALLPAYAALVEALLTKREPVPVEYVRDELVALREALAAFVRSVDGDAASGDRNAVLRAQRLLRPLRALASAQADKRGRRAAKQAPGTDAGDERAGAKPAAAGAKR